MSGCAANPVRERERKGGGGGKETGDYKREEGDTSQKRNVRGTRV